MDSDAVLTSTRQSVLTSRGSEICVLVAVSRHLGMFLVTMAAMSDLRFLLRSTGSSWTISAAGRFSNRTSSTRCARVIMS